MTMFYGLLINELEVLRSEPLEEVFRERAFYHKKQNTFFDTWIIKNPGFLPLVIKNVDKEKENFVILSCTKTFISILNLRLNESVTFFEFQAPSDEIKSPLSY